MSSDTIIKAILDEEQREKQLKKKRKGQVGEPGGARYQLSRVDMLRRTSTSPLTLSQRGPGRMRRRARRWRKWRRRRVAPSRSRWCPWRRPSVPPNARGPRTPVRCKVGQLGRYSWGFDQE